MYYDKLYNKNRKLIFWSQTGQAAVFKTGGITMALAGKLETLQQWLGQVYYHKRTKRYLLYFHLLDLVCY